MSKHWNPRWKVPSEEEVRAAIHAAFGKPDPECVYPWLPEGSMNISDLWDEAKIWSVPPEKKSACYVVMMEEVLNRGAEYLMDAHSTLGYLLYIFDWRRRSLPPGVRASIEEEDPDDFECFTNEQAAAIAEWWKLLASWEASHDPDDRGPGDDKRIAELIHDWEEYPMEGPGRAKKE